ncbi:MAG: tetratricopeptide repeat protein [Methylococcales bacterium]
MSIINQMLRDLESRNPDKTEPTILQPGIRITSKPVVNKPFWLWSLVALTLLVEGYQYYAARKESASPIVAPMPIMPVATPVPAIPVVTNIPVQVEKNAVTTEAEIPVEQDKKPEHYFFKMLVAQSLAQKLAAPVSVPLLITAPPVKNIKLSHRIPKLKKPAQPKFLPDEPAGIKNNGGQQQANLLYRQAAQSDPETATAKLQELLTLNPQHLNARLLLAKTLNQRGLVQEAATFLDESLHLFPTNVQLITTRAQLFLQQKNPSSAVKTLQRLDLKNHTTETTLSLLAASYQQLGAHAQAVEVYQQLVQLNPTKAQHWLGLALMQEQLGNVSLARDAYSQALAKNTLKASVVSYIHQRLLDLR